MSVLLMRLIYYQWNGQTNQYLAGDDISGSIDINQSRGLDIRNNVLTFTIRNDAIKFDSSYNIIHRYINDDYTIKFTDRDMFKLYLKYSDDFSEIESSAWSIDSATLPDDDYLKGTYYLIEYKTKTTNTENQIEITCADKTYVIFNKLIATSYPLSDGKNAPEIIQDIIWKGSRNDRGYYLALGSDAGAKVDIEATRFSQAIRTSGTATTTTSYKLVNTGDTFITDNVAKGDWVRNTTTDEYAYVSSVTSQTALTLNRDIFSSGNGYQISYGFIQDTRKNTAEDGTTPSSTAFPDISFAKVWKAIYECMQELSQLEYTNTSDELDGTDSLVYGRPFLYYVDEKNKFHWFEVQDVSSTTITVGTTTGIYSLNIGKNVFESANMIIWRGGEDFYGNGTLGYELDDSARVSNLRMRVIPMTDIAKKLIETEISSGRLVANTSGSFTYSGNRYNRNGNVTPPWKSSGGATYSADGTYNTALRNEIKLTAGAKAKGIANKLNGTIWQGDLELKGQIYQVGDLLTINNYKTGVKSVNVRVQDVRDLIRSNGWFTNIQIAEDVPGLKTIVNA